MPSQQPHATVRADVPSVRPSVRSPAPLRVPANCREGGREMTLWEAWRAAWGETESGQGYKGHSTCLRNPGGHRPRPEGTPGPNPKRQS